MASRLTRAPVVQLHRHLSAQAAPAVSKIPIEAIETSTHPSGLTIASVNVPSSAVSTLGVVVKAGSRYETNDNLGVSHMLRIAAGLATKNCSSFAIVRNLQQVGAGLTCSQGREYLTYTTQMTRDKVDFAIDYFLDAIATPSFKPWELSDNSYKLALEISELSAEAKASELLHQAAYRSGLGNSIYSPVHMIGKHKPAVMESFFKKNVTANRAILVGIGIDHKVLHKYGDILKLEKGTGSDAPAKYFGGELRHNSGGRQAVIILAGETSGLANVREAVACRLLQKIMGKIPCVPYGNGTGQLHKALNSKLGNDSACAVSSINYSYSDSGLFGAFIVSEAATAGKVVEIVAAALRSVSVTESELKAAKKALLLELNEQNLKFSSLVEDVGTTSILRGGHPLTDAEKFDLVDQATLADVQAAAKRLAGGKLSMSAVGNLGTVPYLDAL